MSVSKNQLLALSIVCVSPTMHERTDALNVPLGPRIHAHVLALAMIHFMRVNRWGLTPGTALYNVSDGQNNYLHPIHFSPPIAERHAINIVTRY